MQLEVVHVSGWMERMDANILSFPRRDVLLGIRSFSQPIKADGSLAGRPTTNAFHNSPNTTVMTSVQEPDHVRGYPNLTEPWLASCVSGQALLFASRIHLLFSFQWEPYREEVKQYYGGIHIHNSVVVIIRSTGQGVFNEEQHTTLSDACDVILNHHREQLNNNKSDPTATSALLTEMRLVVGYYKYAHRYRCQVEQSVMWIWDYWTR